MQAMPQNREEQVQVTMDDESPKNIPKVVPLEPIDESKLTEYDKQALAVALANPTLTPCAIDRKIAELNKTQQTFNIYKRLKKSEYLRAELARIQEYHRQYLTREIMPIAVAKHKKLLKDKDLAKGLQLQAVKLAYDAEWKIDQPQHQGSTTINIKDLRVLVNQDLG
jgi:hypothetical protein